MKIYNKSVKGADHIKSGRPCQDYSISQSFEAGSIVAISDGHGGVTYVRSQVGSKLACEIAVEETKCFVSTNYEALKTKGINHIEYSPDRQEVQDSLINTLFTAIHKRWYNAIVEDSQNRSFTEEERFKLGKADIKKAYGCTLLVAVKTMDFTFIYQLGDGRIFTITPFIRRWQQPVPWDSQCEDNITTSLCNINPIERFRYYLNSGENQPFTIFLCSDGIEDCFEGQHNAMFDSEKMEVEYTEILSNFLQKENFDDLCAEFLSKESAVGSKDDMSIAFIIDDNCNIKDKWIALNRLYRGAFILKSEYDNYGIIIGQNERRLLTLAQNIKNLNVAISTLSTDIEAKNKRMINYQQEKSEMESRPVVCDSFIELIDNLLGVIKHWCDQYGNNYPVSETSKFHNTLKEKLESALGSLQVTIKEMQQQIPIKISKLTEEIKKIDVDLVRLNHRKEQYEADLLRHKNNKEKIENKNEEYKLLKEEKKKAIESYKEANTETLKRINNEIKESMGEQILTTSNDTNEGAKYAGRSWNIAKSPEEYIQINAYNNNVQMVLTDSHGANNNSIPFEICEKLLVKIDELYSADNCSFEPMEKYITIITTNGRDKMVSIELGVDSGTMIWDKCMELINEQQ